MKECKQQTCATVIVFAERGQKMTARPGKTEIYIGFGMEWPNIKIAFPRIHVGIQYNCSKYPISNFFFKNYSLTMPYRYRVSFSNFYPFSLSHSVFLFCRTFLFSHKVPLHFFLSFLGLCDSLGLLMVVCMGMGSNEFISWSMGYISVTTRLMKMAAATPRPATINC